MRETIKRVLLLSAGAALGFMMCYTPPETRTVAVPHAVWHTNTPMVVTNIVVRTNEPLFAKDVEIFFLHGVIYARRGQQEMDAGKNYQEWANECFAYAKKFSREPDKYLIRK